jgi:NAD(P)-dependent dehydrogenase (short-subunit alcohol dehydrogenase family)
VFGGGDDDDDDLGDDASERARVSRELMRGSTSTFGRAAAEAFVLERGATVLTVSGIFGERRSPRGKPERFCLSSHTSAGGVLFGPLLHPELDLHARAHHCASPSDRKSVV